MTVSTEDPSSARGAPAGSPAGPIPGSRRRLEIALVVGAYVVLALLSAVQIDFRNRLAGGRPDALRLVLTNLLAWAPWPVLTPLVVTLWRRRPFRGPARLGSAVLHLAASVSVTLGFLVYLTLFRFALFPEITGPWHPAAFPSALAGEIGRFFLPAWSLYWIIGLVDLAVRPRRGRSADPADATASTPERIELRSLGKVRWLAVDAVDWIEAAGSYVRLHAGSESHLLRASLATLARRLAPAGFVRIHRSAAVRAERVAELRPLSHGDAEVELDDGTTLRASRTHRRRLEEVLSALPPDRPGRHGDRASSGS